MRGLVPRIHVFLFGISKDVDGRVKPGHDDVETAIRVSGKPSYALGLPQAGRDWCAATRTALPRCNRFISV
jgi:hypothetical protein